MVASRRTRLTIAAVAALTAVGFLLRLTGLEESLFGDELFAYTELHGQSLGDALTNVTQGEENSPPVYFVLAWLSMKLGDPTVLIRLPSLIFGTLAIPAVYLAGARIGGRTTGLVAAGLTALGPLAVYFSTEARPYATMMCLLALSTFALLQALEDRRRRWWVLYWATAVGALFSHYTAIPVIAVQAAWALWAHRDRAREVLVVHGLVALAAIAWIPFLLRQREEAQDLSITGSVFPLTLDSFARETGHLLPGFERFGLAEVPGVAAMWMLGIGLAIALLGLAGRSSRVPSRHVVLAAGLTLATPAALLLHSLLGSDLYNARRLLASFPGLVILVGILIASVPRAAAVAATALIAASLGIGLARGLDADRDRPPLREAARYIDARADPGDPVVEFVFLGYRGLFTRHLEVNFERGHPLEQTGLVAADPGLERAVGSADRVFVVEPGDPPDPTPLPPSAAAGLALSETRVWRGSPPVAVLEFRRADPAP